MLVKILKRAILVFFVRTGSLLMHRQIFQNFAYIWGSCYQTSPMSSSPSCELFKNLKIDLRNTLSGCFLISSRLTAILINLIYVELSTLCCIDNNASIAMKNKICLAMLMKLSINSPRNITENWLSLYQNTIREINNNSFAWNH